MQENEEIEETEKMRGHYNGIFASPKCAIYVF